MHALLCTSGGPNGLLGKQDYDCCNNYCNNCCTIQGNKFLINQSLMNQSGKALTRGPHWLELKFPPHFFSGYLKYPPK